MTGGRSEPGIGVPDHPKRIVSPAGGSGMSEIGAEPEERVVVKVIGIGRKGSKTVGKMSHCMPDGDLLVTSDLSAIDCLGRHGEILSCDSLVGERIVGSDSKNGMVVGYLVADSLLGADLVIIVCGMENEEVVELSLDIADAAREGGVFVVIIAAEDIDGNTIISHCSSRTDCLLCISIKSLMPLDDSVSQILSEEALIDHLVRHAAGRIVQCLTEQGLSCLDLADIQVILGDGDSTYMGIGIADGEAKGKDAASRAVQSISRQGMDIRRSTGVLAIVEGSTNMSMDDFDEAARVFIDMLPEENNVVFGCYFDDSFGGNVKVTVFSSYSNGSKQ